MISGEEETSPAKVRAFKAHMKDKAEQEKAKMVQEVADDKMAEGKDTTKEKKDDASKGKGAKFQWLSQSVKWSQKFGSIRTQSQWHSCGT